MFAKSPTTSLTLTIPLVNPLTKPDIMYSGILSVFFNPSIHFEVLSINSDITLPTLVKILLKTLLFFIQSTTFVTTFSIKYATPCKIVPKLDAILFNKSFSLAQL